MRFMAEDGKIFNNKEDCLAYEKPDKNLLELVVDHSLQATVHLVSTGEFMRVIMLAEHPTKELLEAHIERSFGSRWHIDENEPTNVELRYTVPDVHPINSAEDREVNIAIDALKYTKRNNMVDRHELRGLWMLGGQNVIVYNFLPKKYWEDIDGGEPTVELLDDKPCCEGECDCPMKSCCVISVVGRF